MSEGDDVDALGPFLRGRRVFLSGVCGTIGQAVLERLLRSDVGSITATDQHEASIFELESRIRDPRVRLLLGDVRDRQQLTERFAGIDLVLHAAAFKHVGTCERSPRDAVSVNVLGTQNLIDAARASGVERVLFMSSDKAVNPTSVMGASKLLSERLVAAAAGTGEGAPIVSATRFGNVLGSSGSVIRVFARQIARGGPVTITDHRMNRFVMTPAEAVELVLESSRLALGGEIFVTKMRAIRIPDLARVMIDELAPRLGLDPAAIRTETVGARAGEKLFEELVSSEEGRRVLDLPSFYVVLPALSPQESERIAAAYGGEPGTGAIGEYRSDRAEPLDRDALHAYLSRSGALDVALAEAHSCAS